MAGLAGAPRKTETATSAAAGQARTAGRDGVRLAYEVTGTGPALLLIQGLGYPGWGWEPLVAPLARSFTVITFDNRGIGGSDVPPGPYDTAMLAADAAAVLDDAGVRRAHVMGASLGGMIAQMFALDHRDRTERLVLACTTPGGDHAYPLPEATRSLIAEAATLPPAEATRRFVRNALAADRPDLVDDLTARRLAEPQDPAGWQAQAAAALSHDAWDRLAQLDLPTLVLHGTADRVVDPRNAGLLAERVAGTRVELLADRGHLFFWEDPTRVADLVTDFLT